MEKQEKPAQQSIADLKQALAALAGGEQWITPNDPAVMGQLHKRFTSRNQAQFRSQAADRLDALREWVDRSLRYHIVRLRYDPLEENPAVSYNYALQDILDGVSTLSDMLMDAHEVITANALATAVGNAAEGASLSFSIRHIAHESGTSLAEASKNFEGPTGGEVMV
jgi:hypothetical protein